MTQDPKSCDIKQKPAPQPRGEESPVRDKKMPKVDVHDDESAETESHPT